MTAEYAVRDQGAETQNRLLILGASTRAAAESACRAGFLPVCGDMFGDDDLRKVAEVHTVADYPNGLIEVAQRIPASDWIYTGALENCPKLVGRISQRHRLLGNPADVLNAVRDPFRVAEILTAANLPALCVRNETHTGNAGIGEWLRKPRRGGGGRAIRVWNSEIEDRPGRGEPFYLQEYVAGTPVSAVFLASRLNCRPVGITRQLVGEQELHATRFAYCGSLGPLRLPEDLTQQIAKIGRILATECNLRGLFGIDFMLRDGTVFLTEVNPRYTASVEVLELAGGKPLLRWHCRACETFEDRERYIAFETEATRDFDGDSAAEVTSPPLGNSPETSPLFVPLLDRPRLDDGATFGTASAGQAVRLTQREHSVPSRSSGTFPELISDLSQIIGKVIVFADANGPEIIVPPLSDVLPPVEYGGMSLRPVADIPLAGTAVRPGEPVCTVYAGGKTVAECLNELFDRARTLQQALH